ncbi:sperm head and tail associated protein-like [Nycticebus coucang]|uniref:sperm head and tail associated protein-like n=1 Tax=Nycticebus coucang TaxID=9470 RepID=UPI00234DB093|nr:sperm head and tail associated protein-like [Nycticebus coucang]
MTSSAPFLIELPARPPSPIGKHSDFPFPPGSPTPCRKGFTVQLPLAARKGYSDHPAPTAGLSPNAGKRCNDSSQFSDSPHFSIDSSSCVTGTTPCPLPRIPSPPPPPRSPLPQPPLCPGRCFFEPSSSPLLDRLYCHGSSLSCSPPPSPYFNRSSIPKSPTLPQRSAYCSWISPPRMPRPCPRGPYLDQHTYFCYCSEHPSVLGTSPMTSPTLTRRPLGTCPVTPPTFTYQPPRTSPVTSPHLIHTPLETGPTVSPPVAHETLGTCLTMSPALVHQPVETRLTVSPTLSHRVVETGLMISPLPSHWSSGRNYNDPPLSQTSYPPTDSLYHGGLKLPDSCEPKPQLDLPLEKNCCGLHSQAGMSDSSSLPQESTYYVQLSSDCDIPVTGSPHCVIRQPPRSTGSPYSPQSKALGKPCFGSNFSWEVGGNSYFLQNPGTTISGPPSPQEPSLPYCPYSGFFPSTLGNQFISSPQSLPTRRYTEPPLPTSVCPQTKSPKFSELRQSCTPHRCHSLVNTTQHAPADQPNPSKPSTSPPPPFRPSGLSDPPCMKPPLATPSNSCPKGLPPGLLLPSLTVVPRTLKTVVPTSLPLHLPCDPIFPTSYAQSSPHGPLIRSPCNTHIFSVVPSTPHPCPVSDCLNRTLGPPQCLNHPIVPPGGTYNAPRGPPQSNRQPVVPPCSTHIYSFIPLRTPFDPQCLPIAPRVRACPDPVPCGLHTYSVAPQGSCKEPPKIPYSCPLPSLKVSSSTANLSCSSTVIIRECRSSSSQTKIISESRSQSRSNSPYRSKDLDQSESLQISRSRRKSKSPHHGKSHNRSRSPKSGKGKSKSPRHSRSRSKSPQSPHCGNNLQRKSPRQHKK